IAWSFFDPADSAAAAVWFGGVRGTLPQQIAEYVQIDRNGNLLCDLPGVFGDIPAALPPLTARAMRVYPGWFTSYWPHPPPPAPPAAAAVRPWMTIPGRHSRSTSPAGRPRPSARWHE